jgi:hypothetical protein
MTQTPSLRRSRWRWRVSDFNAICVFADSDCEKAQPRPLG